MIGLNSAPGVVLMQEIACEQADGDPARHTSTAAQNAAFAPLIESASA